MATAKVTITYPHVTKTPGVCGGRARVEGTRIRVYNVVFLHKDGASDETIRQAYPDLTPAQIHAALAYYYDNREEIDGELAEDEHFFSEAEWNWDELLDRNGGHPPSDPTPEERAIPRPFPWTPKQ
jgi:uncharacterized protein (DUF433 family)